MLSLCIEPPANMADKPDLAEISAFDKAQLKKTETQEKNVLPTKEGMHQLVSKLTFASLHA